MKTLTDRLNESLFTPGTGYDQCDELTRDYNNQFAMLSGTTLRVIPTVDEGRLYVLTGSCLRSGNYDFLMNENMAISTPKGLLTPAEYLQAHGLNVFTPDCDIVFGDMDEDYIDNVMAYKSIIEDTIKDSDYLIIF